ncbi:MAG: FAD-binding protein [Candidatus Gastranaerophilales bacterium]|nr:FAD-binding protein [Candidatus Gastranaerophilales bacterium]
MLLKDKLDKIKTVLKNDNVLANLEERYCYSRDAYNMKNEGKIPDLVVFVETVEEVQKVLKYANEHEIPVVSRGAGTNMVGACVCAEGGIVLNFSKMNKILELNTANMTARVQPGVILGDLKKEAESHGLFYPPDPSNFKVSTVGGSIAQSSGGAMSFKYGTTKDYVLSLKVVTADGRLMTFGAETIKDASGYHLGQLIVGSEGTLAIVVEAVLKLIPKPESKRAVSAYFRSMEDAITAVNGIIAEHIFPAAIDFMDKNSMITVEEFAKCGLKTENECMLIIDLDGFESSMNQQIHKVNEVLTRNNAAGIEISDKEDVWEARRSSFAASARLAPDVISDDIIVPRENLAKMIKKCNEISAKYNLKMCLVGHVGDGNIHPQIALNLENDEEFKNYISAKSEMYDAALSLNGTISAEHGIGIEKLSYLGNTMDKNVLECMKMIKLAFDPKNILNPGKIFK